jgi:signal transduction histidine kinase/CheY-like chemotaxis protein
MTKDKNASEQQRLEALFELDLLNGGPFIDIDRLVNLAAEICGGNIAAFTVHDAENAHQVSASWGQSETIPKAECMCSTSLATNMTVHTPDARADTRFAKTRDVLHPPHVRSFISVPVGAEPDQPIGVLAVGDTDPGRFNQRDVQRLEKVAELISAFLLQRRTALRATRAATKTGEERQRHTLHQLIFEAIQEGVNVHTPQGDVIEMNAACLRILGLTRDEMLGRGFSDPRWRTFKADGSPFLADEYPVAVTLRTGLPVQNVPMGIELPSGELRWIVINSVPLRNAETDEVEYGVVTMKDVTAQHQAELRLTAKNVELAAALAAAEKANRVKTDFMGVMSHELRTPMNAVLSCANLLSQTRLDPAQKRMLGVLDEAGRQMLALLNDLLDLSSFNADKVRIDPQPVPLVRLIEDAAVIWSSDVRAKGLTLSVRIDPGLRAPRMVDSSRLLQIIGNLLANATKFTSEGGVTIQAWPEKAKGGADRIAIEVEDTGPGVPAEAVERIFSAFEQVDVSSRRRHGGLGLGLHVARRLANAMGGDITLETMPGEGSRFTVRIDAPIAQDLLAGDASPNDSARTEAEARDVLCVDDNPRNLFVISAMLRAAGHSTTECSSGAEALEVLGRRKFDVIMLDMVMPDMDGLETLSRLRTGGGLNSETPVIACTANVLPDQVASYREAGTIEVLAKPIDPKAMLQAVATAA